MRAGGRQVLLAMRKMQKQVGLECWAVAEDQGIGGTRRAQEYAAREMMET
jgi:hypothetical protein